MYNLQILVFDPSTELEVEIVAHSSGNVWNKADGVDRLIKSLGDSLEIPGHVLICGDTPSDLPMIRHAAKRNPQVGVASFADSVQNMCWGIWFPVMGFELQILFGIIRKYATDKKGIKFVVTTSRK